MIFQVALIASLLGLAGCTGPKGPATQPAASGRTAGVPRGQEPRNAASSWPVLDESFLQASAETLGFRLGKPQPLAIASDGSVLFRRSGTRDRRSDLYVLPPDADAKPLVTVDELLRGVDETLSPEERARRERTRTPTTGVVDCDVSDDASQVLIGLGERSFIFDRSRGHAHELALGSGSTFDPHLSPDGKRVSFVRDGDLWVISATEGGSKPRRLTHHPAGLEYGVAEFVAQEEFDRPRGYFWSPDSRWLAFQRTDARRVSTIYVADPSRPERAPAEFKYPRPGSDNAVVDLGIVAADGGEPRWLRWDLARFPYLVRVQWPKRGPLSLLVMNRAQTELSLLAADPVSGATRELLHVADPAWVNVPAGSPTWLDDGSGFLWLTESELGFALELHDATGATIRTLQPPSFGARTIVGVMPDGSAAIVTASQDPREQHVWRVPLHGHGEAPAALSSNGGVHEALSAHGLVVVRSALRDGGSRATVIAGDRRRELQAVSEQPTLVPSTQLETVESGGRTFYTAITRPRSFDPGRRYPTLIKVYGGPGFQSVLDYRDGYLLDQWYADAGFIVIRADGRGSPHRGRSWERAILGELASIPLADQVSALSALAARHPQIDRTRVGIFGWSFGGYLSTIALLIRPDVFQAAIAGAPVTDWSLYDTAYTERYLKLPADNADAYRRASTLSYAAGLTRPLLIVHGVTDDNVHFAHTLALIEALYREGKRAEVVALATTHMLTDPKQSLARERLQVDFFRQKLGNSD